MFPPRWPSSVGCSGSTPMESPQSLASLPPLLSGSQAPECAPAATSRASLDGRAAISVPFAATTGVIEMEPPCRFGCRDRAVGIFWFKGGDGCICWPDPVQALCAQHEIKAKQNHTGVVDVTRFASVFIHEHDWFSTPRHATMLTCRSCGRTRL